MAEADREKFLRSLEDLAEPSSGEKAVSRVSGVPLKESAPPVDDRGEEGLKWFSRGWAMVRRQTSGKHQLSDENVNGVWATEKNGDEEEIERWESSLDPPGLNT